jgi:hypothetical protein
MRDANGQSLAYLYTRENPNDAHLAKVLTEDEARRIPPYSAREANGAGRAGQTSRTMTARTRITTRPNHNDNGASQDARE